VTSPEAIVVGGGLAGSAAAVAAARAGLATLHVAPKGPPDRRTSALMLPSVDYLQSAGLVGDPAAIGQPLTQIRIIDATKRLIRAPETLFDAAEFGMPAFGWNFPNVQLMGAFEAAGEKLPNLEAREASVAALERRNEQWFLRLDDGTEPAAPLLVGADGKKSLVRAAAGFRAREHSFSQSALVADLELSRPLGGASVEFHYPRGPFTLVPAGGRRANLVWIDDADVLKEAQAGGKERLREALLERSQRLFGDIELLTPSFVFSLSTVSIDRAGMSGIVLVGEAAHAFPPIGAQGLNLGLRDVADLSAAVAASDRSSSDWAVRLSVDYAKRRAADLARTGGMVDALFRSLVSDLLPAQAMRATGLWALKLLPPLRKQAFRLGMGAR
jgi:2-octaprenyl-6-methoxyphenol hydroxylase